MEKTKNSFKPRPHVLACIFALFFLVTVHFYLKSSSRHTLSQEKARSASIQLKLLKEQKRDGEQKRQLLSRIDGFLKKVRLLGIEKSRWSFYDVFIQEPISFSKLEQIINQCTNSPACYFRPDMLQIKVNHRSGPKQTKTGASPFAASSKTAKDLQLTLKGAFITHNR